MESSEKIPVIKIALPITGSEAVLDIGGDYHYGASKSVTKENIVKALNDTADQYRGRIFRILTGDLIENQLKTSVGHNYDVLLADPAVQKQDMIDILTETNEYLYGKAIFSKLKIPKDATNLKNVLSVGVEGNHEYRTRKMAGQWISKEMHQAAKIVDMKFGGIVELTISNQKLKMEKTYRIYVSHRPSKTDATSIEAISRAFKKKQSMFPGIDIIVFGHFHRRFICSVPEKMNLEKFFM
jgi:predicted phosphodiesterase